MDWDQIESKWAAMTRRARGTHAADSTDTRTGHAQVAGMNPPAAAVSDPQPRATADALETMLPE